MGGELASILLLTGAMLLWVAIPFGLARKVLRQQDI
jgi:hypothetical protein